VNYLENFGVLKGVGVNAFKFFGVEAGVLKKTVAESEQHVTPFISGVQ